MTERGTAVAPLSCGHTMIYRPPPYKGDIVWCSTCRAFRKVIDGPTPKEKATMKARCRDCSYSRNATGMNEAIQKADQHCLKRSHAVDIVSIQGRKKKTIRPPEMDFTDMQTIVINL